MITSIKNWKCFLLEKLINEAAYSIDDVIDNELILAKNQTTKDIELILYNIKTKEVIGFIKADKADNKTFEIAKSASEKGYGPLMYDLLMMSINPYTLKPSNTITDAALMLYKYYNTKRNDVSKVPIKESEIVYNHTYRNNDKEDYIKKDKETLDIINTRYSLLPNEQFNNLVQLSDSLIKDNKLNRKSLFKRGLDYFWNKYELPLNI